MSIKLDSIEIPYLVTGTIVPTISYFDEDNSIQQRVCRLQAAHALHHGANSLFVLGSTGEGTYLKGLGPSSDIERIKLALISADAIVEHYEKTGTYAPLLLGAYGNTAFEVLDDMKNLISGINSYLSSHLQTYAYLSKIGRYSFSRKSVDGNLEDESQSTCEKDSDDVNFAAKIIAGFVVPPPLSVKVDDTKLAAYYSDILDRTEFPIYMYNNPGAFSGNVVSQNVIEKLSDRTMLRGVKDSSGTLEQKKAYLQYLSSSFSVSCGKEGMMAKFLREIPLEMRKYAGIVPSLSNLTNNPALIMKLGLAGKDDDMITVQDNMNEFRYRIYDARIGKGKAQRGIKMCMHLLYENKLGIISQKVRPEFSQEIPEDVVKAMRETLDYCMEQKFITPIEF